MRARLLFPSLGHRLIATLVLGAVLLGLTLLGHGAQQVAACNGAYCSDALQPTSVAATPNDSSSVRVSWLEAQTTVVQLVNVRVRRDTSAGPESLLQLARSFDGTRHNWYVTVPNLSFATNYCFGLQTHGDTQSLSEWSAWACTMTPFPPFSTTPPTMNPTPPAIPQQLASTVTEQSIEISWNYTGTTPSFFRVNRDGQTVGTTTVPGATFTDTFPVARHHTYLYNVCAAFSRGDLSPIENCSDDFDVNTPRIFISDLVEQEAHLTRPPRWCCLP